MDTGASALQLQRARRNAFAALQLDRVHERRDDGAWLAASEASATAQFIVLDEQSALLADSDGTSPCCLNAVQRVQLLGSVPAHLLGVRGETPWFVIRADEAAAARIDATLGTRRLRLRDAGLRLDVFFAGLFAYAVGLVQWHVNARYCGHCGARLQLVGGGHRADCAACGHSEFPRTDAAIIVIVEHDGACLLGRGAGWPEGRYSALAGFVEPGETLEHAVCREVDEEAGVEVTDVRYHSSQPWPFPASLMVGFMATARERTITLRDGELADARWFTPQQLAAGVRADEVRLSSPLSVSYRLLEHWLALHSDISLESLLR